MRGDIDREGPLESVFQILGSGSHGIIGPYIDTVALVSEVIKLVKISAITATKGDIGIFWVGGDISTLTTGYGSPVPLCYSAAGCSAVNANGAVVLLCPVDSVRELIVCNNLVELCCGIFVI